MKFYLCVCAVCTWKGNKPHRDGQCPVCGNALDLPVGKPRSGSDPGCKVVLSGLSVDSKNKMNFSARSGLSEYRISGSQRDHPIEADDAHDQVPETHAKTAEVNRGWAGIFGGKRK